MSTIIYLIRHAEAEGNVYRRCHGIYDALLTEKAWVQLPYLAKRFENVKLDVVYASHLYRARHTAKAIAEKKGMKVTLRKNLHEIDMGDWEDYPWAELGVRFPNEFELWRSRPWDCKIPSGETVTEAGDRVLADLHKIAKQHEGGQVAVVSHGSAIRSILCRVLKLEPEQVGEIGWGDNTCVAKLIFEDGEVKAEYWNDASHLPEELSTFAAIGWKDNKGMPTTVQVWFRNYNPDDKNDNELLLSFIREQYNCAYGTTQKLDENEKLLKARKASEVLTRAVTFAMLDNKPVALVFLDAVNGQNAGMVGCYCIDKEYRGHGIAQQLIGQSMSVYRSLGKDFIFANAGENNQRAIAFYKKFGFEQVGITENECGKHFLMRKSIKVPTISEESQWFEIQT